MVVYKKKEQKTNGLMVEGNKKTQHIKKTKNKQMLIKLGKKKFAGWLGRKKKNKEKKKTKKKFIGECKKHP